jgi:hypothetical protein
MSNSIGNGKYDAAYTNVARDTSLVGIHRALFPDAVCNLAVGQFETRPTPDEWDRMHWSEESLKGTNLCSGLRCVVVVVPFVEKYIAVAKILCSAWKIFGWGGELWHGSKQTVNTTAPDPFLSKVGIRIQSLLYFLPKVSDCPFHGPLGITNGRSFANGLNNKVVDLMHAWADKLDPVFS